MSLTKISSPDVLAPVGARSYWVASGNPILFKYQRKDLGVISVTQGPAVDGVTKIKVSVSAVPAELLAGQKVYINNFGYEGTYEVINKSVGSFVLDATWIGNQTGGFVNFVEARNNYHMDINVYRAASGGDVLLGNYRYYDNTTGIVTIDLQGVIDAQMNVDNEFDYSVINAADEGKSFAFIFYYRENWRSNTSVGSYTSYGTYFFAVKAVRQLGDPYGQNMRDYMLDVATDPVYEDYIAKFLSVFERPVYFVGYPFTLSFLYTQEVSAYYLIRKEQEKDINSINVGAETSATLLYPSRTQLNRVNNRKGYGDTIASFQLWLEQGDEIDFGGGGYGTGTGGDGASTDYFAENYDENWGT